MNQRIQRYFTNLGNAFRNAYKSKIDLHRLYTWGEGVSSRLADDVISGRINENDEGYDFLTYITGITHQLHDGLTRDYFSDHPDELEQYAKMLLGERDPEFPSGLRWIDEQKNKASPT